jgi:hypothetical protein
MTITKRLFRKSNYLVITLSSPDTVVPGPGSCCTKKLQESSIDMQMSISGNLPDGVGGSSLKKRNRLVDDTDSDNNEKGKQGKTGWHVKPENEKMHVARAMEVFGKAAKQQTSILKETTQKTVGINAAEVYGS